MLYKFYSLLPHSNRGCYFSFCSYIVSQEIADKKAKFRIENEMHIKFTFGGGTRNTKVAISYNYT